MRTAGGRVGTMEGRMGPATQDILHVGARSFIPFARFRGASRLTIKTDACSDRFWSLVTDALTPQEARELGEDLGIERDTGEHEGLEKGPLCSSGSVLGKRRR